MSKDPYRIGREVHLMLLSEGGFVWTHADGRKTIHFNKGCKCSSDLARVLREYREDLKAWVDEYHRLEDAWSERISRRGVPNVRLDRFMVPPG